MSPVPMPDWRMVVPVKDADHAKSRLLPPAGVSRSLLARAFAQDTLEAVVACIAPVHLVVVTGDRHCAAAASALGAMVQPDPGTGLNPAVRAGVRRLGAELGPGPTAVLLGDLPALRPRELAVGLQSAGAYPRAVVPDAEGTGTVLLTAAAGVALRPMFGTGSAARHGATATRLELKLPSLRCDVDDDRALHRALALGVGRHTARALGAAPTIDAAG